MSSGFSVFTKNDKIEEEPFFLFCLWLKTRKMTKEFNLKLQSNFVFKYFFYYGGSRDPQTC